MAVAPTGSATTGTSENTSVGLTVPGDAVGLVVMVLATNEREENDEALTFGGLAMSKRAKVYQPGGHTGDWAMMYFDLLDISGRSNDTLVLGNLTDSSVGWIAQFLSAGGDISRLDAGSASISASGTGTTNLDPAGSTGTAIVGGWSKGNTSTLNTAINSQTQITEFTFATDATVGMGYQASIATATNIGISVTSYGTMYAVLYGDAADIAIEPDPIGTEVGFFDGPLVEASGDRYVVLSPLGVEVGFFPGIRVDSTGEMQVALVGSLKEAHRHTTGGTEGDVLTFHEDSEPTWEAGGGGGPHDLDSHTDVNAPTPSNGDVLTWDSTPGEWVNAAPAGGASALDDLTDVDAPTPSDGDVLTFDSGSGDWINAAPDGVTGLTMEVHVYESGGSPHTWTKPMGLVAAIVEVQGAGGGGGGTAATSGSAGADAGGGGAGGYARKLFLAADLPTTCTATVGTGGSGGSAGANAGSVGNDSTFAGSGITTVSGSGGNGGSGSAAVASGNVNAVTGGAASGGDLNIGGNDAGAGFIADQRGAGTGYGAPGYLGAGRRGTGATITGKQYGGGGAGASSVNNSAAAKAGGTGADGVIIVTEFISTGTPITPATSRPIQRVYTADDTWSKPAGLTGLLVEVQGGGGGAGGTAATGSGQASTSPGAGAGGYARKMFDESDLPSSCTVTVGGGGGGGSAGANNGSNGSASSFAGSGITTVQGNGGALSVGGTVGGISGGGAGGTASGGDINISGGAGGWGYSSGANVVVGAYGGGSPLSPVSRQQINASATAGNAYGGGAPGVGNLQSQSARAGGAGAAGVVIVTEYY